MNFKKIKTIFLIGFIILLSGCGHNVLTDYEVTGLDLSVPIGGYPFGVRIGMIKVNSNMVRGNATYTSHNNVGTEIGTGSVQKSNVIQFSSNAQINEGNVEKIMNSKNISDDVKNTFVKEYLGEQQAPPVLSVTSKTPTAVTIVGDNPKLHKNTKLEKQENIFSIFSFTSWTKNILLKIGDFFILSAIGKLIMICVKCTALFIILLFIIDLFKKIFKGIINVVLKFKKKKPSIIVEENQNKEETINKSIV